MDSITGPIADVLRRHIPEVPVHVYMPPKTPQPVTILERIVMDERPHREDIESQVRTMLSLTLPDSTVLLKMRDLTGDIACAIDAEWDRHMAEREEAKMPRSV